MTTAEALAFLIQQVESYLDRPGCNDQSKATAMNKLRWAVEEAKK